ncbi:hypothetical protein BKA59DRAFT_267872 [Fusarium tricinctum]|uniref:Uncharacterized protein n=1 Tax=Fusarium tricinctum TaxID=61284 RepID=A0A8K0RQK0_9HYPO|nr:hypothetical protein BKA59DRAFT_267872 [Fusarium tricinctum]
MAWHYPPRQYHRFCDTVFSDESTVELPPHRPSIDCEITLKEGEKIWQRKLIDMPLEQQKVLKQYLNTQLEQGFIQSSTPPSLSRPVCHGQSISHEERTSYDWYRTLINTTVQSHQERRRVHLDHKEESQPAFDIVKEAKKRNDPIKLQLR